MIRASRETVLTILLIVAALAVGNVITARLPKADEVANLPFVHTAALGVPVTMRTGTFAVTKVDASPIVGTQLDTAVTGGLFLVLTVDVTASGEPLYPASDDLRIVASDGREFGGRPPVREVCGPAQPGLTLTCMLPVEITPDALAGSRLRLPAANRDIVGPGESEYAEIDLGISADAAAELAGRTTPILLAKPTVKGK